MASHFHYLQTRKFNNRCDWNPELLGRNFFKDIFFYTIRRQQIDPDALFVLRCLLGLDRSRSISNCHFCTARFSIYMGINRKYPEPLYITFWRHLLCHDQGIHHQAKHRFVTVGALLTYLVALNVHNRFYLYPTFLSFLLHTAPKDVLNMIDFPHTQLDPTTQNPCMPVCSLENRHCVPFFDQWYANVFENI
jgi:hypothetical protein